jgi:uncharacterized membrane protein
MPTIPRWQRWTGLFAIAFGAVTVVSGGLALFGGSAVQGAVGDAVPFVLWFNATAGFAYVLGGLALLRGHPAARALAWGIGLATLAVFGLFLLQVRAGTPYEPRTMGAMILRAGFWLGLGLALALGRGRVSPGGP